MSALHNLQWLDSRCLCSSDVLRDFSQLTTVLESDGRNKVSINRSKRLSIVMGYFIYGFDQFRQSSCPAIIEQTLVYLENHEFESFRPKLETKTRQSQRSE